MQQLRKFKHFEQKGTKQWLLCVVEMVLWKCFDNFPLSEGMNRIFEIDFCV